MLVTLPFPARPWRWGRREANRFSRPDAVSSLRHHEEEDDDDANHQDEPKTDLGRVR
jgi:hypothetical protein